MTYPDPLNQFYRLVHTSGPDGTGTYAKGSRWNQTHNGVAFDSKNCTPSIGAVALNAHTGGRFTVSPAQIRAAAGDWVGGMNLHGINDAWAKLAPGNQLVIPQDFDWADTLHAVKERRFVPIQGDNDQMGGWSCQAANSDFLHAYALAGWRVSDGRVLLYDPLCTKARWIPQYAIRLAAEKLAMAQRGTKNRLFVALTRVMPPPYDAGITYRYGGEPRFRGRYLARRDNVPIRTRPDPAAPVATTIDYRDGFAARQSASDGRWLGNADGTKWVYYGPRNQTSTTMWYGDGITGQETVS